jgi:hypothetical protein
MPLPFHIAILFLWVSEVNHHHYLRIDNVVPHHWLHDVRNTSLHHFSLPHVAPLLVLLSGGWFCSASWEKTDSSC